MWDLVGADSQNQVINQQIELDSSLKLLAADAARDREAKASRVIVNSKGKRLVLRVHETPLHDAGDASLGGMATDSTELDKTKQDLSQHIESNQRTLDQLPTGVVIFGQSQNLVYHNRAFAGLWGLDDAFLTGRIYHGEILDRLRLDGKLPEPEDYETWKDEQLALYTAALGSKAESVSSDVDELWRLPDGRTLRVSKIASPAWRRDGRV